jgi:hypothetical protein
VEYPLSWTCELIALRFEAYLLGTLPRGEALAVAEHVEACIGCAQHLALSRPAGAGSTGAARRG